MGKPGASFERLVHSVYKAVLANVPDAKVSLDETIVGPDGPRQFDVVIRHRIAGMEFLTLVECKDHEARLNIGFVDAFHAKIADVKGSKGVLVTRRGFTGNAKKKAERLGIELCVAGCGDEINLGGLRDIPILVRKVRPYNIAILWRILDANHRSVTITQDSRIQGVPAMTILLESYARGIVSNAHVHQNAAVLRGRVDLIVDLEEYFGGRVSLEHEAGILVEVGGPAIGFRIEEALFFGHTKDIQSAKQLVDINARYRHIVFDLKKFSELHTHLSPVRSLEEAHALASGNYLECIVAELNMPESSGTIELWRPQK